ncbi:membrane transporter of cations and cationic drugs [Richelia sinica FACHB-800]|uniref:Membrane transporter of cations and cationic drugs n=1 Tax=Richelia sinica FACHB-800 TaxID=1357546 RepID=A0A975T5A4_9NOST|nr:multidrug efflux SMR transporter [Richelia sinica]MBD2664410.1 multidrug efflux SMR transporter [Richelia sinica FACHB-800]QXE22190.1 membrane transporter of cations and cationic drugs [Richelia sinica FACHB-800]
MAWLFLFLAIACEIFGTVSLKLANGFSHPIYLIGTVVGYPLAFSFFGLSLKTIEVSIGYAVWSGVGIVGTSVLGSILFKESFSVAKTLFMGLILAGVIGLSFVKS